jgi:two-component system, chemotaxis family, sensor kinase CheA
MGIVPIDPRAAASRAGPALEPRALAPRLALLGALAILVGCVVSFVVGPGTHPALTAAVSFMLVATAWAIEQTARRRAEARFKLDLERREKALADCRQATSLILDNISQVLLLLDATGKILSERSAVSDEWLGPMPPSMSFLDYVGLHSPEFAESLRPGLVQLVEDVIPAEVTLAQLPARLKAGKRVLSCVYKSIVLAGDKRPGLVVTLTDITGQLQRETAEAAPRDLLGILDLVRRNRAGVVNFLQEGSLIVEEIVALQAANPTVTNRLIHTLKGNAAQFGLSVVANACHEIEERIHRSSTVSIRECEKLSIIWDTVANQIGALIGGGAHRTVTVDMGSYRSVMDLIRDRKSHEELFAALASWDRDPVQARLDGLGEFAERLGQQLGKDGLITVREGNGHRLDYTDWAPFWTSCVHVIRNAVDHGIEDANERAAQGKPSAGTVILRAEIIEKDFVVTIADDGRGINWEKLAKRAQAADLPFATEEQRLEVLFSDGMSTRTLISAISGRGVGLSAFRAEVVRRRGTVEVTTVPRVGTTFTARFPVETSTVPEIVHAA